MKKINELVRRSLLACALLGMTGSALAQEAEEAEPAWTFSAGVTATTDYLFRGVSQSSELPAIQPEVGVSHASGLFLGIWGSNIDYDTPGSGWDTEIDYTIGWSFGLPADTALDVYFTYYTYPGSKPGFELEYGEWIADYSFAEYFTATLAYTSNYFSSSESSFYYRAGAEFPLGETGFNVGGGVGYNDTSKAAGSDYIDYQVGINRSFGDYLSADLSFVNTASFGAQEAAVIGLSEWASERFVFSIYAGF